MKHTSKMKPKTKFGRWLLDKMTDAGFSCEFVAKELGTTRQTIRNHIVGVSNPSYVWVVAYCWYFNSLEDLTDIWYSTMEEP